MVALDKEEKTAIGFICLERTTNSLSLIKYLFVHPMYGKMGLAKKLLSSALVLEKETGAKKVNLNVYPNSMNAISLYKKIGFREAGQSLFAQGSVLGANPNRILKCAF